MANNAIIIKATIGILLSSGVLGFMGYGIVNNDIRNTGEHTEIRKEVAVGDEKNEESIDEVKDIVTDIRLEQKAMVVEQKHMINILQRLDK